MLQQNKGWGENVIVMYTWKDNLTPLLYSGKIKKAKKNKKTKKKKNQRKIMVIIFPTDFLTDFVSHILFIFLKFNIMVCSVAI